MKRSVKIERGAFHLAGDIYLPPVFDETKKYSAIITVHPGGGVKEQTSGLYAQKLAQLGYITLAFDAAYQGESGGMPRFLENPTERVEDIRCGVDYLVGQAFVDAERIGLLGICAGGGYALAAGQVEKRIRAIATVSGVDIGGLFRESLGGNENINRFLSQISAQRTLEANGAEALLVGYIPTSAEKINDNTAAYVKEAYEYYCTPRAQHPNAPNKVLFTSFARILGFSAFSLIPELLTQPILLIAGTNADTRHHSERVFTLKKQGGTELFWIQGATHVALYDVPEYVEEAVDKLDEFFTTWLHY